MIHDYLINSKLDTLFQFIYLKTLLYVYFDGSRSNKNGWSWIISSQDGTHLVSSCNVDFYKTHDINSYYSEVYASIVSIRFLRDTMNIYLLYSINNFSTMIINRTWKINRFIE